jgi:ABC-type bacteriocin/lantibiotic exporter with double-glycine peptidase domain
MFKKIFSFLERKEKKKFLILLIFLIIGIFIEALGLGVIVPMISFFFDDNLIRYKSKLGEYFPETLEYSNQEILVVFISVLIFLFLLRSLFLIFITYLNNRFIYGVKEKMAIKLYNSLLFKDEILFDETKSNDHINLIQVELEKFINYLKSYTTLLIEIFFMITILCVMLYFEFNLTLLLAAYLAIFPLFLYLYYKKKLRHLGELKQTLEFEITNFIMNAINNLIEIRVLNKRLFFKNNFSKVYEKKKNIIVNYAVISQSPRYVLEFIIFIGMILIFSFKFFNDNNVEALISTMTLFLVSSLRLMPSINKLIINTQNLKYFSKSVESINSYIKNDQSNFKVKEKISFNDEISFEKVCFKYSDQDLLKNISFKIKRNDFIGIVGPSGSGKSTILKLLMGVIKPDSGNILIDSKNFKIENNYINIGYVGQRVNLIRGTLTQNIAFGYEKKDIDKEKLDFAINISQLRSLVDSFDEGLDKMVIDNGLNFSGGQIQRIGIARALYNNPEILVFDEPTSAIDNKLKEKFLKDIFTISKKKTIIMVTHNKSDLKDCNKIIELDKYE